MLTNKVTLGNMYETFQEDDSSIIIVDPKADAAPEESLQMSSNQHGHLVQQILDSTKEFSQSTGKTEIVSKKV